MYYIYVLRSLKHGRYYTGLTGDLRDRLHRHNSGRNRSTKHGVPWTLIYSEQFFTRQEAYKREKQIKQYKGGRAFKDLLKLS